MIKNGIKLFSRQSSNLNLIQKLICRNFITLKSYSNLAVSNNVLPNNMPLISFQTKSMCSADIEIKNITREIFVRNIPLSVDSKSLEEFFSQFGKVKRVQILLNDEGKSIGKGFVDFYSSEDCDKALSEANNINMEGNRIRVELTEKSKAINKKATNSYLTSDFELEENLFTKRVVPSVS